jgi:hypothetical protein
LSSQAVKIPPEAPTEGLKTKERRDGGRKEEARKEEMSMSLVSCRSRTDGRAVSMARSCSNIVLLGPHPKSMDIPKIHDNFN